MRRLLTQTTAALFAGKCVVGCSEREQKKFQNVHVLQHPGTAHLLSRLRDRDSSQAQFMSYSNRLLRLLVEEAFALEPMRESLRFSPTGAQYLHKELLHDGNYCVVVILRSALSMLNEISKIMPHISVGMVLVQRNEESAKKEAVYYYCKMPPGIAQKRILLVDPMLGTGGSATSAIRALEQRGVKPENIVFVCLVSCPEGIERLQREFPGLKIITGVIDPILNDQKYIVPGLGDFGDRYFGTVS